MGENVLRQQADVLGKHSDDTLKDEAARAGAIFAAIYKVEGIRNVFGGFTGDFDPVVSKQGPKRLRKQKVQRGVPAWQLRDPYAVNRFVELCVEVINPELIEVAERDVRWPVRNQIQSIVESLLVVLGEFDPPRLHLDETTARPDEVSEFRTLVGKTDAIFERAALRQRIRIVAKGFEKVKKESLGLALFIALEFSGELSEFVKGPFL